MAIISLPMLLHGLFDTLAKKELNIGAFVVALLTFGWLQYLIRQSCARERISEAPAEGKGRFVRTAQGTRYVGD